MASYDLYELKAQLKNDCKNITHNPLPVQELQSLKVYTDHLSEVFFFIEAQPKFVCDRNKFIEKAREYLESGYGIEVIRCVGYLKSIEHLETFIRELNPL